MLEFGKTRHVPPYNPALVFAGLRDAESAVRWLALAFADRGLRTRTAHQHDDITLIVIDVL